MPLVTGDDLATLLDLDYPPVEPFDQVAKAADDVVRALLTPEAYNASYPACKEAALSVAVEIYQSRYSAGGQAVASDFSPGPYRLSVWMTRRVMSLLGPYLDVRGVVG
jgi:hypothetical protein